MITLSPTARQQIAELRLHYVDRERPEAIRNLVKAIEDAAVRIARAPGKGLPAPRPYPDLAYLGWHWLKVGAYWFGYVAVDGGAIVAGVFHESADIPGRV